MSQTKIEWTEVTVTVNPFPGCKKISPGCQNCYAERMAQRLKAMGQAKYQDVVDAHGWTGKVQTDGGMEVMRVPGKGKMVFVQSMGDLFYEGISPISVSWVIQEILQQPQHTWQILTKRPDRALAYYRDRTGWTDPAMAPHIWMGTTCEDQEWADQRIPILIQIPAAVRFASMEPLLVPIHDHSSALFPGDPSMARGWSWADLDWVIVGCESGPGRRPCDNQWVADIVAQCHAAGVPVFVKQIRVGRKVEKDPEMIALELTGYFEGGPLCVGDIQQWPRVTGHESRETNHHGTK